MNAKFKVGDIVCYNITFPSVSYNYGCIAKVVEVFYDSIKIEWLEKPNRYLKKGDGGNFRNDAFELSTLNNIINHKDLDIVIDIINI